MVDAKVFNGINVEDVSLMDTTSKDGKSPIAPSDNKNGTIFISIASFRDGKRCGETLRSIFDNAMDPDKVFVGIVEQNYPEDEKCLEIYCNFYHAKMIQRRVVREEMTKILVVEGRESKCPRFSQVRVLAFFNPIPSGPQHPRALQRKLLGNEEYCLQIDAHSSFIHHWDVIAKEEWKATHNEFAILSTSPAAMSERDDYESRTGSKHGQVPRICKVRIADNSLPEYVTPANGNAINLVSPLLSYGWSPAFSFSKCHLEETTPNDPFLPFIFGAEAFSRYARLWTRGYDVYTPTQNIVYHDYTPSKHMPEWKDRRQDGVRAESLKRLRTLLGDDVSTESESAVAHANLGLYGLGARRTLQQLKDFAEIDWSHGKENLGINCANKAWVAYDHSISPVENLYQHFSKLNLQPEFTLRSEFQYLAVPDSQGNAELTSIKRITTNHSLAENDSSFTRILFLWAFGLILWCVFFTQRLGLQHIIKKSFKRTIRTKKI